MNEQRYFDAIKRILNFDCREIEPAIGDKGLVAGHVREVDADSRTLTAVVSSEEVDRYGEVVLMSAFKRRLDRFMRENPVFLKDHEYKIDNVIGEWLSMEVQGKELVGKVRFDDDPDSEKVWQKYLKRTLKAFSVGFLVHGWEMRQVDVEGQSRRVRHFTDVELIEVSAVAIGANRAALVRKAAEAQSRGGEPYCEPLQLKQLIADTIREELNKHLDADLNTRLEGLIERVVEAYQGRQVHGHHDDDAPAPGSGKGKG